MAKIVFKIRKDGTVTADVDGAQGTVCKDMTKPFTDALGAEVESVTKPEMYDQIDDLETVLYEANQEE